jgi:hypothetical protein
MFITASVANQLADYSDTTFTTAKYTNKPWILIRVLSSGNRWIVAGYEGAVPTSRS